MDILEKYCKEKLLDFKIGGGILYINDKKYIIVDDGTEIFNDEMECTLEPTKFADGFIYHFGGRWYIQESDKKVDFKELIYIDNAVQKIPTKNFLGIHSGYELMNGLGLLSNYVKKGKFLGVSSLGICEKDTLSSVLEFQGLCLKEKIKPIIGMTITVKGKENYDLKLYVKNFQGWLDLLKINTIINVDQKISIPFEDLKEYKSDLFFIADPKTMNFGEDKSLIDFYQLDTVNFLNEDEDKKYINNLEKWIGSDIKPISITDSYYLEQDDYLTREALWMINKTFDSKTDNQHMKSKDEYAKELIQMFDEKDRSWIEIFKEAVNNENYLVENCNFIYDTSSRHLPKYIMNQEESKLYGTNGELFKALLKKGFKEKNIQDPNKYMDRLKTEIEVLEFANVIDYFLSLYDIFQFSKEKDMIVGLARGSAAGSLVAYLLGITKIDPIEFDLLFERFLNVGRAGNYEDRPLYIFTFEDGTTLELPEGSLVRINRDGRETADLVDKLREGDIILKYN